MRQSPDERVLDLLANATWHLGALVQAADIGIPDATAIRIAWRDTSAALAILRSKQDA